MTAASRKQAEVTSIKGLAPTPLLVMCLILGIWLAYWVASKAPDFNNLALGEQTAPVYGSLDGTKIFCGTLEESAECLKNADANPAKQRVLWIGNSQLFAVNQAKPGAATSPIALARDLAGADAQVSAFAMPNASLSEMLLMYQWMATPYRPDVVMIPAFLDDTREQKVRAELGPALDRSDIASALKVSGLGDSLRGRLLKDTKSDTETKTDSSMQARSEAWLTGMLEACCNLQTARGDARGNIEIQSFFFRNWLFNVTAQTVRPIIPEIYRQNLAAADALLADGRKRGFKMIFYVPPLRKDHAPPYDLKEYAQFKVDTKALADKNGARWVDLDAVVPGQFWGTKAATRTGGEAELDFMHYTAEGHALLAKAMLPIVREDLK